MIQKSADQDLYLLPSSPQSYSSDRFSLLDSSFDSSSDLVPTWPLLHAVLSTPVHTPSALPSLLETITLCISDAHVPDYTTLTTFLATRHDFFPHIWQTITRIALDMPTLFPSGALPILTRTHPCLELSRAQAACLIAHQFLCTLRAPPWQAGFQSFHIWYAGAQPQPSAVEAYLTAVVEYFRRLSNPPSPTSSSPLSIPSSPITYTLHHAPSSDLFPAPSLLDSDIPLQPLTTLTLPTPSTHLSLLGLPHGAAVVSANKLVGFGPGGTQEEAVVGASPEACPVVLVQPPLKDDEVLVVQGAVAIVEVRGYGRGAGLGGIVGAESERNENSDWTHRTMLFMDALELDLDLADPSSSFALPDLQPGNLLRERTKAYIAFSSSPAPHTPYDIIYTGLWGCGAFGGDPAVKAVLQWIAASMAGVELRFVCAGEEQGRFAGALEGFVACVREGGFGVGALDTALRGLPEGTGRERVFEGVLGRLGELGKGEE